MKPPLFQEVHDQGCDELAAEYAEPNKRTLPFPVTRLSTCILQDRAKASFDAARKDLFDKSTTADLHHVAMVHASALVVAISELHGRAAAQGALVAMQAYCQSKLVDGSDEWQGYQAQEVH